MIVRIAWLFFLYFAVLCIFCCSPDAVSQFFDINSIQTFRDVPGVTADEIAAIETIISSRKSFSVGSVLSTEAFISDDKEYSGFIPLFCGLLSNLFDIPFVIKLNELDELINMVDDLQIDFTGEFSPTPERQQKYFMSSLITERSFSTANPDLQAVITVITKYLETGGIDVVHDLYTLGERQYSKFMFNQSLTPEERRYIEKIKNNGGKIPITMEPDNYPLCFYNNNYNEFQGIAVDILDEITLLIGIEFEPITTKNTTMLEIHELVKSGKAAFDAEMIHTAARENDYIFPNASYYSSNFALLSKTDYPDLKIFQIAKATVGIVRGTAPAELFNLLIPDSRDVKEYNTRNEALVALEKNDIDLFMTTDYMLLYQTHFREKTGYKINILLNATIEKSFYGFNKNEKILCSIIEKAQDKIDIDRITRSWTNRVYDYSKKIASNRLFYMAIFTAVMLVLLIILSRLLSKNRKMIKKIDRQNELLKTVNQVSTILLEPDIINLKNKFMLAMSIMAKTVNANRVTIWKNHTIDDEMYSSLIYEWPDPNGVVNDNTVTQNVPYKGIRWKEILSKGDCINSLVRDLPEQEQKVLKMKGVLSIFIAPVFIDNIFWGYLGFDDCKSERVFTFNESMILRSAGRMLGNAFIRNDITQNIVNTTIKLEDAVAQANESSRQKNVSLNSMKSILNGIDSMIYVTNPKTNEILFMNNSMMRHFDIDDDCTGKLCYMILQANRSSKCEFCPCYRLDKEPTKPVVWEEHSSLTNRIYCNVDRYIDWPDGQIVHIQHSVDMTELIEARERAEESSHYKSAFLTTMSHEIRTPMNAILGITEIQLQNKNLPPDVDEAFNKIYESGDLLLHIINDILDLSKIESGKMEIVPVKYDIPSLINDAAQLNRLRYESKPIWFSLYVDENMPHDFFGDELRIKQILNNVLSNAFKYTDEGSVELYVTYEPIEKEKDSVMLVFRVVDTGQGMTDDQIEKIYDEYTRFNLDANRTTIGAGLGMNITKRLVDMMNGTIKLHSEVGKGTVFSVRIPQNRIGNEICGKELTEKLRSFRYHSSLLSKKAQFIREYMPYGSVLVVDDVESNIFVIKGMLQPYGMRIDAVSSGYDAIEKIKDGNVYDIVFMDHMMPRMDGVETVKIIRDFGYTNPIIALTANALIGREEMFLQNGFDAFVSKPIDSRELNHLLNEYIRNRKPQEVVDAARRANYDRKPIKDVNKKTEIESFFVNDAEKAIKFLEKFDVENISEESLEMFIVIVHGMKSALANVDEKDMSNIALNLEQAGREKNLELIAHETPAFLKSLKDLTAKLKPHENNDDILLSADDVDFLREKLLEIKTACADFNKSAAKSALKELKQMALPGGIKNDIDNISLNLLHSDFTEAAAAADVITEKIT